MRFIKRISKQFAKAVAIVLLVMVATACGGPVRPRAEPETKIVTAPVIVATGCINGSRPEVPPSLRSRFSPEQWAAMPPGAKAAAIQEQSGRRMNYEDALRAATAGCN